MPERTKKLNDVVNVLSRSSGLTNSFSADPVATLSALNIKLSPQELELAASLDKETLAQIADLKRKVETIDPAILAGHSGGFVY